MEKLLTVAILNWNGQKLLEKLLPVVLQNTSLDNTDIAVIDNGSTDNSVRYLQKNYPMVQILQLDKNYGFAEGYNKGIEKLNTPYICLLNSDVEPALNWIDSPLNILQTNPTVFAVQPKIKDYYHRTFFEYAGAAGGFIDALGYPFCRGRIFETIEEDKGQYEDEYPIFWASGACLFVRKDKYVESGGLDTTFFAHMEEIDLCWRFQKLGGTILYTPKSEVFHMGGASLDKANPKKTYLNFRNNLIMLYKNLDRKTFWKIYIIRFFMDLLSTFVFFLKGKTNHSSSIIRAERDFWKTRKNYTTRFTDKNHASIQLKPYSIVWGYFLRKKKLYQNYP